MTWKGNDRYCVFRHKSAVLLCSAAGPPVTRDCFLWHHCNHLELYLLLLMPLNPTEVVTLSSECKLRNTSHTLIWIVLVYQQHIVQETFLCGTYFVCCRHCFEVNCNLEFSSHLKISREENYQLYPDLRLWPSFVTCFFINNLPL